MATTPAPRGTRAATMAILAALDKLPPEQRKTAFRHVSVAVKERLAKDAERAKKAAGKPTRKPAVPKAAKPAARAAEPVVKRGRVSPDKVQAARRAATKPAPAPRKTPARRKPAADLEARAARTDSAAPESDEAAE